MIPSIFNEDISFFIEAAYCHSLYLITLALAIPLSYRKKVVGRRERIFLWRHDKNLGGESFFEYFELFCRKNLIGFVHRLIVNI